MFDFNDARPQCAKRVGQALVDVVLARIADARRRGWSDAQIDDWLAARHVPFGALVKAKGGAWLTPKAATALSRIAWTGLPDAPGAARGAGSSGGMP